ncbi:MAG: hypothetical protein LBK61_09150 [Spirochaetaceae bacterium]|nr:hypothetical protein [Spirochaetaceae bacterium]
MYSTALRDSPANRCRRTVNISHNFSYVKHNRKKKYPAGGENPKGFHPFFSHPFVKPLPVLAERAAAGRQNTVMWRLCFPCGRAMPPHDGILPAGNYAGWGRDE